METIIYLIRHSTKFDPHNIGIYNASDSNQIKTEKKMLSVEGELKAYKLSKEKEFGSIDVVYCSNYVRAMQTAKYFIHGRDLKLNIDERLNERTLGDYNKEAHPNFFCDQYWNKELKGNNGESQNEVNKRITEAFWDIVNENKGKRIVIVSHGTAISFLLMNWCELIDVQASLLRKLKFKDKIVINRIYKSPEVFKIIINENNEILDIENIEFDNLEA